MSEQKNFIRIDFVFPDEIVRAGKLGEVFGILNTICDKVFSTTPPRSPMMRNDYHATDSAKRVAYIIVSGRTWKTVEHNHTWAFRRKLLARPHYFTVYV